MSLFATNAICGSSMSPVQSSGLSSQAEYSPKSLEMIPACRHTPIQDMETSKDSTQHLNYMRPSAAGFTTQLKGPGGIDLLTTPTTYPNSPSPMSPNSEFLHNSRRTSIITMPPLVAEPLVELGTPHGPSFAQNSIAAKTHSRKAMIICSWNGCGKEFAKPSLLKAHLNVHTMVRPYECQHCLIAFTRNHDLRRHERTVHGNHKEALCSKCQKRFARADSARFHERTCLS